MLRSAAGVYISTSITSCKWERPFCLPRDGGRLQPARDRRCGHVDGRVIRDRRVLFILQTLGVARCLFSPSLIGLFTSSIHSNTVRIYTHSPCIHSSTVRYIHSPSATCIHSSTVLYIHSLLTLITYITKVTDRSSSKWYSQ